MPGMHMGTKYTFVILITKSQHSSQAELHPWGTASKAPTGLPLESEGSQWAHLRPLTTPSSRRRAPGKEGRLGKPVIVQSPRGPVFSLKSSAPTTSGWRVKTGRLVGRPMPRRGAL